MASALYMCGAKASATYCKYAWDLLAQGAKAKEQTASEQYQTARDHCQRSTMQCSRTLCTRDRHERRVQDGCSNQPNGQGF